MNTANNKEPPDLVQSLLKRAEAQRSLSCLAMALKAHRPDWGSQGTLVVLGLTGFLSYINWSFSLIEELLPDWINDAQERMDERMLDVRLTQIQELSQVVREPSPVVLTPDPDHEDPALAKLLSAAANAGLLHHELAGHGPWGRAFLERSDIERSYFEHAQRLDTISVEDYLHALPHKQRDYHPNVLHFQVLRHLSLIGYALDPALGKQLPLGIDNATTASIGRRAQA